MKKLRWGVIGAGGIADRRTIPGMMLAKNAELIAVMDINAEQVEKIRQKYGAKRGYTKEEDLLADPEVDAVYIATPIVLHAKQAKLAADYGKDILIEKPLAMTSDEGQEVIEYCESKGVKIAAGFMMRFGSHVMSMKKAIAEGKIGTVVSGYSQFTLWLPYEPGNWRQCKAKAGGGQRRLDPGVARADHGDIIPPSVKFHRYPSNTGAILSVNIPDCKKCGRVRKKIPPRQRSADFSLCGCYLIATAYPMRAHFISLAAAQAAAKSHNPIFPRPELAGGLF